MTVENIVRQALSLKDRERDAFLAEACVGNEELRFKVEAELARQLTQDDRTATKSLLDSSEAGQQFELNTKSIVTAEYSHRHLNGMVIAGRYTLLEKLGVGGMGEVWVAQQTEPVRRRVAIKLIKEGMDSKGVLARFEAERQALAVMDHPNIAKVFDAGLTEQGHPYFVMECINGVSITRYCDDHKLTPRARLELFVHVCQAIQHAHQKGIIHRDIKPSNVMVASYDDVPVPKVIDFGVAKATGGSLTDITLHTGIGMIVGTPEYMSPEQASLSNVDIDTRSDVYSLGALLYELLAGSPPFQRTELAQAGLLEILRVIREEEPPKPSTKLSTADTLDHLSANRGTESNKLPGMIRHELDWIVMKALAKERERRYESASALAQDVERHLRNEPVLAGPPSARYRIRKFLGKHRGKVLTAAALLATLILGIIGTTWQAFQARHAEKLAREDRDKAIDAEADSTAFGNFLVNHVLAAARPEGTPQGLGIDVKLSEALSKAQSAIPVVFKDRPNAEIRARKALGITWRYLGRYSESESQLRRAVSLLTDKGGPEDLATLECLNSLAVCLNDADRTEEAVKYHEQVMKKYAAIWKEDHPDRLMTEYNLANCYSKLGKERQAIAMMRRVRDLRIASGGVDHPLTLKASDTLAAMLIDVNEFPEALKLRKEVREGWQRAKGPKDPDALLAEGNYAHAMLQAGQPKQAVELLLSIREKQKQILGPSHLQSISTLQILGAAYLVLGQHAKGLEAFEEALSNARTLLISSHEAIISCHSGKAHALRLLGRASESVTIYEQIRATLIETKGKRNRTTLTIFNDLGTAYFADGRIEDAIKSWEEARDGYTAVFGANDFNLLAVLNNLAGSYMMTGRYVDAIEPFEKVLASLKKQVEADHPTVLTVQHNLASAYFKVGRAKDAIAMWTDTRNKMEKKFGKEYPSLLAVRDGLAMALLDEGKFPEALEAHQVNVGMSRRILGVDHPSTLKFVFHFVEAYRGAGKKQEALTLHRELITMQRKQFQNRPALLAGVLEEFAATLTLAEVSMEAEPVLREALALRSSVKPESGDLTDTRFQLGSLLILLKKYDQAEPLLIQSEQAIRKLQGTSGKGKVTRKECLERLVRLYTEWMKPEPLAKWKAELSKEN